MTSSSQLQHELKKSIESAIEKQVRAAAPPGVRVTKTKTGYSAEGDADAVTRMVRRLKG